MNEDESISYYLECKKATEKMKNKKNEDEMKKIEKYQGRIYVVAERWMISKQPKKYRCNICQNIFWKNYPKYEGNDETIDAHLKRHYGRLDDKQIKRIEKLFNNLL